MKAYELMTKSIESVRPDATVEEVMQLLARKMIRSVLVEPKGPKDGFGVIAVRDIVNKVLAQKLDPKKIKAGAVATKPVICVKRDMDTDQLLGLMQNYNIARVFVTDGEAIVGVVAYLDFIRAAAKM
ncbi:MAG TPA: CBS domain-containing protein [Thermodesulfovibrionales bacterium]|jgi:CBS domain-containing protein|nr:CBS domain-containing protein [Thermodesulfovibrionales bacterium]